MSCKVDMNFIQDEKMPKKNIIPYSLDIDSTDPNPVDNTHLKILRRFISLEDFFKKG